MIQSIENHSYREAYRCPFIHVTHSSTHFFHVVLNLISLSFPTFYPIRNEQHDKLITDIFTARLTGN